ncbi:hypothetical protein LUX32_04650 [Actinomadura madurae]|nr:hypothetical protein [Actinomadura madurae]MCP9977027.1 hypothetical protein [Actinomadura madurae]
MSSWPCWSASRASTPSAVSSRVPSSEATRADARRAMPSSTLRIRLSTRPSVYRARVAPGGSTAGTCPYAGGCSGSDTPSGSPFGTAKWRADPSGMASSGGGCPARATSQRSVTGSHTRHRQVANWAASRSWAMASSRSRTSPGGNSQLARVCAATRSWPIAAAAVTPCPTESPITTAIRSPVSGTTSYQSPPTPLRAGR